MHKEERQSHYPSLDKLPGVEVDEFGNLIVTNINIQYVGLRHRFEFVMNLEPGELGETILAELLEWLRWGSPTGVMWEFTLSEMAQVIARWEADNPKAGELSYGVRGKPIDWLSLWSKQGFVEGLHSKEVKTCPCGEVLGKLECECPNCRAHWTEAERSITYGSFRGAGTYNLALQNACGVDVANAAYHSRGKERALLLMRGLPKQWTESYAA